jgi:hypothetical protein
MEVETVRAITNATLQINNFSTVPEVPKNEYVNTTLTPRMKKNKNIGNEFVDFIL